MCKSQVAGQPVVLALTTAAVRRGLAGRACRRAVAAGITVHQALAAADRLAGDDIRARVIDAYSVKPIDADTLRQAAPDTGRIATVEDHWPQGGRGDAVLEVFADGTIRCRRP